MPDPIRPLHDIRNAPGFMSHYMDPSPALIQAGARSLSQLAQAAAHAYLESVQSDDKWLALHDELHNRFKEGFKTWEQCCQSVYKCGRETIWKRKQRAIERLAVTMDDKINLNNFEESSLPAGNGNVKQSNFRAEERALSQVEKARDVPRENQRSNPPQKSPPKPEKNGAPEPKVESAIVDKTIRDKSGFQVPESLIPTWNRRDEIQALMSAVSNIKCDLEKRRDDPLFPTRRFSYQSQLSALEQLHYQVSQCKPDVVCPECDGALEDKDGRPCGYCALTGFICQSEWHQKYEKSTTSFMIAKVAARGAACH